MFIAGTNMATIYFGLKGNFKKVIGNIEFVFYFLLCIIFIMISSYVLHMVSGLPSGQALMEGSFHVVSIITTTGYYTGNYNLWGNLMIMILFLLMFTGGTAGSTSGGIKIIRLLLITKNSRQELKRLIHPSGFLPVRHNNHTIPQSIIFNLLVFITIYFISTCFGALIMSFMGYDIITSFSTSASMLANIGPGIGTFGPFSNYSALPVAGKFFLSGLMLLGRLEFFAVMILFTKSFYRH
jgi:trk system potassium uptake protein TrkH